MECGSCGRRHPRKVHCETRGDKTCKDCCIKGGGMGCMWWGLCW